MEENRNDMSQCEGRHRWNVGSTVAYKRVYDVDSQYVVSACRNMVIVHKHMELEMRDNRSEHRLAVDERLGKKE